ncbi:hypothetical protein CR513_31965, partial [Mucuna pruriens]
MGDIMKKQQKDYSENPLFSLFLRFPGPRLGEVLIIFPCYLHPEHLVLLLSAMADHTRSKTQTERLEDAITKLTQNQNQLTINQSALNSKNDDIISKIASLKNSRATSEREVNTRHYGPKHETDHGTFRPRMKIRCSQI